MASKLFVGNLARTVTDNDLADFVTNAGFQVASAQVIRDRMTGDPKGFGFVQLAEGTDLQQAIGRLNGQVLQDRPLTVNEARPQRAAFRGRGAARALVAAVVLAPVEGATTNSRQDDIAIPGIAPHRASSRPLPAQRRGAPWRN